MSKVSKLSRKDDSLPSKTADWDVRIERLQQPYLPVDVQHADEGVLLPGNLQRSVDPADDAVEQAGVDLLGQGVPGVERPLLGLRLHQRLGRQNDPPVAQPARQPLRLHRQQLAEDGQVRVARLEGRKGALSGMLRRGRNRPHNAGTHRDGRTLASTVPDVHVPQVQNGCQDSEDIRLEVLLQPCKSEVDMGSRPQPTRAVTFRFRGFLPNSVKVLRVSSMSFPSSTPSMVTSPPRRV